VGYLLTACRLVIGLTFLMSFVSKVRQPRQFVQTIKNFRRLPEPLANLAAIEFLALRGLI
jgi:uncharacterized membrane protein YphA (DoxX/SURF4 family)